MRLWLLLLAFFLVTIPRTTSADDAWQLTFDGGEHPTWFPDGTLIEFSSSRSGNHEIWIIPATGGVAQQITTDGGAEPAWSPDGSEIAFASVRTGIRHIWAIPANGDVARQVTVEGDPPLSHRLHPTWSPDGSQIAFAWMRGGRLGPWGDISVVPASRGVPETSVGVGNGIDLLTDPAWSPDGYWIAYTCCPVRNIGCAVNADTVTEPRSSVSLTDPRVDHDFELAWSPDESQVAFASTRNAATNNWIINVGAVAVKRTTWGAIKASFK